MGRGCQTLAMTALTLLVACSSSKARGEPEADAVPATVAAVATVPYGSATVAPTSVSAGGVVTLTPTGPVTRVCLRIAKVYTSTAAGLTPVGTLGTNGAWQDGGPGTSTTLPACGGETTRAATGYKVPAELTPGTYVLCLTEEPDAAGCGSVTVT